MTRSHRELVDSRTESEAEQHLEAVLTELTELPEDDWPTWENARGDTLRATRTQVSVLMLVSHGVSVQLAAALSQCSVQAAHRTLRHQWAKEWVRETNAARLVAEVGLATSVVHDVLQYGRSEKVRSELARWVIEHAGKGKEDAPKPASETGITLNVTLGGNESAPLTVDGTAMRVGAVEGHGGPGSSPAFEGGESDANRGGG